MICNHCGKELEVVDSLTDDEIKDISFIKTKYRILDDELNGLFVNAKKLKNDEQVSEYFHAVYNQLANTKVLDYITFKKIFECRQLEVPNDVIIEDGKIWQHPTE